MFSKKYLVLILIFSFLGCTTTEEFFDDITAPDYVNSSKAKRLEVPPDLSEVETNNSYNVPGEAKSYRDYLDREQAIAENSQNSNQKKVIENPDGMKIIKSGNLRWLVVQKEPDLIWPHVKDFWEDLGFRVVISNKRTGIIETEWMDTEDLKLETTEGTLSTFDKWLDSLSGFADKRKFRTRVEIGEEGTTEIYISQRSAEAAADQHARILSTRSSDYNVGTIYKIEEYKSDDKKVDKKVDISEQREIDDYEIDSELLTRLMIKLGSSDLVAKDKVNNPEVIVKSELIQKKDDLYIRMNDPYDRSWRRLGLALDIIGFVTEDKNRSEGIYFVRYSQIDLPEETQEEEGIIDALIFWDDDKKHNDDDSSGPKSDQSSDEKNEIEDTDERSFSGIEAPQVKPIDEDYIVDEYSVNEGKKNEEETWLSNIWPKWGAEDDNILPENEKRYRIRIKPDGDSKSIVFMDFPSGKRNITKDARKIMAIVNEHLK